MVGISFKTGQKKGGNSLKKWSESSQNIWEISQNSFVASLHLANILNSPSNGYLPLERGGHVLAVLPLGEREVAAVPQQLLVRLAHVEQLHVVVGRAAANHSSVFTLWQPLRGEY